MKLHKDCKPEACTSADTTRYILNDTFLDRTVEPPVLVSTDGRKMAIIPVEVNEHDATGWISDDVMKAARKTAGRSNYFEFTANGLASLSNGVTMPRSEVHRQQMETHTELSKKHGDPIPPLLGYPQYRQVIPKFEGRTVRMAIDSKLLRDLALAFGSDGVALEFEFNEPSKDDQGNIPDGTNYGTVTNGILVKPTDASVAPGSIGILMPMRMS